MGSLGSTLFVYVVNIILTIFTGAFLVWLNDGVYDIKLLFSLGLVLLFTVNLIDSKKDFNL